MENIVKISLKTEISKDKLFDRHVIQDLLPNRYYTIFGRDGQAHFMSPILKSNNVGEGIIYIKATFSDIGVLTSLNQSTFISMNYTVHLSLIPESEIAILDLSDFNTLIPTVKENGSVYILPKSSQRIDLFYNSSDYFIGEEDMKRGISILNQRVLGSETRILLTNYSSEIISVSSVKIYFLMFRK